MKTVGRIIGAILLLAAIAVALAGYYIGTNCIGREPVNLTPLPDPMDTVRTFFDSVCAQDYPAAYACLSGYDSLGLENVPDEAYAAAFWKIVRGNTSWVPLSECSVSGTEAKVDVNVISPDLNLLTDGLGAAVNARIEEKVEEAANTEDIYDAEKNFLPDFIMEVYDEVLTERLEAGSYPTRTDAVTVTLTYSEKTWRILPDSALLSAFTGGAA